ncbi:MAG: DUF72 domain-containing protein [Candidatus Thorarchaeota archaeon]
MRKGLHIGTSGWSYPEDWKGVFYTSSSSLLNQYLRYFETSEINSTFYALPRQNFIQHLANLDERVFFTAKIPKKVTHDNRLDLTGEGGEVLQQFLTLMRPIASKVPVLLIQLPPWPHSKMADLEAFLTQLDPAFRYAIEFRHESWLSADVWSLLEEWKVAQVIVDEPRLPIDLRTTADFAYIRWHGHGEKLWYRYRYSEEELSEWVPRIARVVDENETVLGYFNNHFSGNAPLNALQMLSLLGRSTPAQARKLEQMLKRTATHQTTLDDF